MTEESSRSEKQGSNSEEQEVSKSPKEQGSKSRKERVFDEILKKDNSNRSQWINFYKVIIEDEEQTEQRKFLLSKQQNTFFYSMILIFVACIAVVVLSLVFGEEKSEGDNGYSAPCLSPEKQQVN